MTEVTAGPFGVEHLLARSRADLDRVSATRAADMHREGAWIVDIRTEANRRAEGCIPGSRHVERIVLEWRLDPAGPDRLAGLSADRPVVLVCNEGYASSVAAAGLRELGLSGATDLIGGFRAWHAAGLPVATA